MSSSSFFRLSEIKVLLIIGACNLGFCLLAAAAVGAITAASGGFGRPAVVNLHSSVDVYGAVDAEGVVNVELNHAEFVVVAVRLAGDAPDNEIENSMIKVSSGDCSVEGPGIKTIVQQMRRSNVWYKYNWVYSYFSRESNCSNIVGLVEQKFTSVLWEPASVDVAADLVIVSTGLLLNPHINHTFEIGANSTRRFGILLPQNKLFNVKCRIYVEDSAGRYLAEALSVTEAIENLISSASNFPKSKEKQFTRFIELQVQSSNEGMGIVDLHNVLPHTTRASVYFEFEDIPLNIWSVSRVITLIVSLTAVLCTIGMFVFLIARGQQLHRLWMLAMDGEFDSNQGIDLEKLEKLRMLKFSPKLFSADESIRCAICLMDYEENQLLRFLPCGHHFHQACGDTWLLKKQNCPLCQQDVETAKDVRAPHRSPLEEEESRPILAEGASPVVQGPEDDADAD